MIHDPNSKLGPAPLPWRRLAGLARPIRLGLAGMVGLSTGGALAGLVPPLALGVLVNALVERNDKGEAALLAGLIGLAVIVETVAYIASDRMYAKNAGRLYRSVRLRMFEGARARACDDQSKQAGLPARFISDAETLGITVSVLDSGSMLLVEFASAIVALVLLAPWTVPVVALELLLIWIATRRMQQPVAFAGQRRQEELEHLTLSVAVSS